MKTNVNCGWCGAAGQVECPEGWDALDETVKRLAFDVMPPYCCPDCKAKHDAAMEADASQAKAERGRKLLEASGIPPRYWDGFNPELGNKQLVAWIKANAAGSLCVQSKASGRNKTWATCHCAARIARQGHSVAYHKAPALFRRFSALLGQDVSAADKLVSDLKRVSLLVVDDLGKECLTQRGMELGFEVIDGRLESGKPLWLTTNAGAGEIERKFGERGPYLARRLREMCKVWDADANQEIKN
jgi:hypothetical protein